MYTERKIYLPVGYSGLNGLPKKKKFNRLVFFCYGPLKTKAERHVVVLRHGPIGTHLSKAGM
jgi:hypothetical protein